MKTLSSLKLLLTLIVFLGTAQSVRCQHPQEIVDAKTSAENRTAVILGDPYIYEDLQQRNEMLISCLSYVLPDTVQKLYCFHGIAKVMKPAKIVHRWFHNEQALIDVALQIRRTSIRAWSWLELPENRFGKWRVEILDGKGQVLKTVYFEIVKGKEKPPRLVILELPDISVSRKKAH